MLAGYLRFAGISAVVVIAAVGVLYALADPQGLLGTPRLAGVNALKPYLEHDRELARGIAAERTCAVAGIFGNSRAEIGFDPQHRSLAAPAQPAFNHAIPGSGIDLARDQLRWLEETGCVPRVAVVGVEFLDFLVEADKPMPATPALRPRPERSVVAMFRTMFTLTSAADALRTFHVQHSPDAPITTPLGFNPLRSYDAEVARGGHAMLFDQRIDDLERRLSGRRWRLAAPGEGDFAVLGALLARARANGTRVVLVAYPYHLRMRRLFAALDLEHALGEWKRSLAIVADAHGAELWDFARVAPPTSEPIPPPGDTNPMAWYWESGHFKRELGDAMLEQMLGGAPGFGVRLSAANAAGEVERDRLALEAALHATHAEVVTPEQRARN